MSLLTDIRLYIGNVKSTEFSISQSNKYEEDTSYQLSEKVQYKSKQAK